MCMVYNLIELRNFFCDAGKNREKEATIKEEKIGEEIKNAYMVKLK